MSAEKQPWLKFYPADWRGDLALAACSLAARGLWMEMLCIMSEATPRGSLAKFGAPYTVKQLALMAHASIKDVERLLAELEAEGVLGRDADGTIFSRRMRRDTAKAAQDKANGKAGGNPALKGARNRGVNPPVKAQKLEARGQKPPLPPVGSEGAVLAMVGRFFARFPKREAPDGVLREMTRLAADGVDLAEVIEGAGRYAAEVAGRPADKIAGPVGWLRDGRWKVVPPAASASLPVVEEHSPAGRAWNEDAIRRTGRPLIWPNGRRTFPTEYPSSLEVVA